MKSFATPTSAMPERSPLMSAANTGTPALAKPSAITCNETVFQVPVAPVTRPWRFASANVSHAGCSPSPTPLPTKIFSSVSATLLSDIAITLGLFTICLGFNRDHTSTRKTIETSQRPFLSQQAQEQQAQEARSTGFVCVH